MTKYIIETPNQPELETEDNERWPPERPAEIPLSAKDIEANSRALLKTLQGHRMGPNTKTLADHPTVASYYLPELNGGIPASDVPRFLDADVIWCCNAVPSEVHRWRARPQNFTRAVLKALVNPVTPAAVPACVPEATVERSLPRHHRLLAAGLSPTRGCPGCSGRMATEGNNLKLAFPEVVDHWDFEINPYGPELYLPRSVHEVFWRDPVSGRRTLASIVSRTQRDRIGTNRKDCGLEASESNNLALFFPGIAARLVSAEDGSAVDPLEISPRSNRTMIWRCEDPRHPDFKATADAMVRAELDGTRPKGCPACRGFVLAPGCSLADMYPEVAADYERAGTNPVPASEVIPGAGQKADFQCGTCGHTWRTTVFQRTRMDQGCPACFGSAVTPTNNLAARFPELVAEWHPDNPMKPTELRPSSMQSVLWRCKSDPSHIWRAKPADRTRKDGGTGCPHCDQSGVSNEQMRFFKALKVYLPSLQYETREHTPEACRLSGTRFVFDAVLPEWRIAIEYDGGYWHTLPEHLDRDRRKNAAAEADEYSLIRLRLGLEAIGADDVLVGTRLDVDQWVELVFRQVMLIIERISRQR
jgi:hypothetical protein